MLKTKQTKKKLCSVALDLCCHEGFSLVMASKGLLFVAVHRLLIAVASLVTEHRL